MAPVSFAQKLQAAAAAQQSGRNPTAVVPRENGVAPASQEAATPPIGATPQHPGTETGAAERRRTSGGVAGPSAGAAVAPRQPAKAKPDATVYYELSSAQEPVKSIDYTLTPAKPLADASAQSASSMRAEARPSAPGSPQSAARPERPRSASRTDENRAADGRAPGRAIGQRARAAGRSDGECSPSGDSRHWEGRGTQAAAPLSERRSEPPQPAQPPALALPQPVGRTRSRELGHSELGQAASKKQAGSPLSNGSPSHAAGGPQSPAGEMAKDATGTGRPALSHTTQGADPGLKPSMPQSERPLKRASSLAAQVLHIAT